MRTRSHQTNPQLVAVGGCGQGLLSFDIIIITMKKNQGFTIVELLITIVILGVLVSVSMLAYNGVQNRAKISLTAHNISQYKKILEYGLVENDRHSDINWLKSKLTSNSSLYSNIIDAGDVGEPCFSETMTKDSYCYYYNDSCSYPPGCTMTILIYWNYSDSTWHMVWAAHDPNYPEGQEPISDTSRPEWGDDSFPVGSLKG